MKTHLKLFFHTLIKFHRLCHWWDGEKSIWFCECGYLNNGVTFEEMLKRQGFKILAREGDKHYEIR